jgi:hypothetical protein
MDSTVVRIVVVTVLVDYRVEKLTEYVHEAVWMDGKSLTVMKVHANHSYIKFEMPTTTPSTGLKVDELVASIRIKR